MDAILGITDGDDGGAALLVEGKLVAAVNEERLNRLKMSIGFPRKAISEVLRLGGLSSSGVSHVAMAGFSDVYCPEPKPNKGWFQDKSSLERIRNEISSALSQPLGRFRVARKGFRYLKRLTLGRRRRGIERALNELKIQAPIHYHEHHRCHAIAAFDGSGFHDGLALTLDGGGDGYCSIVYDFSEGRESELHRLESFHSIGNFYAYVTHLCGFRATIHEGKITGLAAAGEPRYIDFFRKNIPFEDGNIVNRGRLFYYSATRALRDYLPADWEHRDLAASVQQHLEETAVAYVKHWLQQSGKRKVALAGGVFANVRLNQEIAELPECDQVFIFPAMGDGGLAAGAAMSEWRRITDTPAAGPVDQVYLGPEFSDREIEVALDKAGVEYSRPDDIEKTVARLVYEGNVVARFHGPMEYGPRALGNRTIMYRPDERSVNDWLNKRLNRTEFMPFAPACLPSETEKLFHWNEAAAKASRFMTITLDCTDWMKEHCQAVVHIDGTARPQVVDEETNPSFHKVIRHYHELSGIPALVNTSFNMHEEPIVCTPEDAIRAFQRGRLDSLALGPFLLGVKPGSGSS